MTPDHQIGLLLREIEKLEAENERLKEALRLARHDMRQAVAHINKELEGRPHDA